MQNTELDSYLKLFFKDKKHIFLASEPEPTAIRVNTLRFNHEDFLKRLKVLQVNVEQIAFNPNGFIVPEDALPLSHTLDFFCGKIQYQGISSQIPALVLKPKPGERVLDMAAAPGSKSTQLAALMQNMGSLYLNDSSRSRMQALHANVQKAGVMNQILLNYSGERLGNLFPNYFDKILIDAPCTALGTLNSQPEVAGWWNLEKLSKLSAIQERLLISGMKALKPGGEMVYSTCSIAPEENELVIQKIIDKYPMEIIPANLAGAENFSHGLQKYQGCIFTSEMKNALRVFPHEHGMEGFFVIRLRKTRAHIIHEGWKKADFVETKANSDSGLAADLAEISQTYGIPESFWAQYRFIRTQKRIWLTNKENTFVPSDRLTSTGMLFAEKKQFMWKLFNQSAQFLGEQIKHRRIQFEDEKLKELFAFGKIQIENTANGYYVIERRANLIGSIYVERGTAQIRLPHRFRLVL